MTEFVITRIGRHLRRLRIQYAETAYLIGWMNGAFFGACFVLGIWAGLRWFM